MQERIRSISVSIVPPGGGGGGAKLPLPKTSILLAAGGPRRPGQTMSVYFASTGIRNRPKRAKLGRRGESDSDFDVALTRKTARALQARRKPLPPVSHNVRRCPASPGITRPMALTWRSTTTPCACQPLRLPGPTSLGGRHGFVAGIRGHLPGCGLRAFLPACGTVRSAAGLAMGSGLAASPAASLAAWAACRPALRSRAYLRNPYIWCQYLFRVLPKLVPKLIVKRHETHETHNS